MDKDKLVELPVAFVERLVAIADRAGVKQGVDIEGPHDTVIVEQVRAALRSHAQKEG